MAVPYKKGKKMGPFLELCGTEKIKSHTATHVSEYLPQTQCHMDSERGVKWRYVSEVFDPSKDM